jgi:hypothetical protein
MFAEKVQPESIIALRLIILLHWDREWYVYKNEICSIGSGLFLKSSQEQLGLVHRPIQLTNQVARSTTNRHPGEIPIAERTGLLFCLYLFSAARVD